VAVVETGVATRVPYLRFAARFPICSFSSGVKCWYGDRLDVTVVTSHVTTAYNFAEKTFMNWLQTVKFAKVFSLESFPLYGNLTDSHDDGAKAE